MKTDLIRWLLGLVLIGFVAAWAIWVWPTQWRYYKSGSVNLRVNRFTGETQKLQGTYGWE